MKGYEHWNFPAFDAARSYLGQLGWSVVSPADLDRAAGFTEDTKEMPPGFLQEAIRRDFAAITSCDAIAFLAGWEYSTGAQLERQIGLEVGCQFFRVDPSQWLFEPEVIIGFSGYARSGKDTAAAVLVSKMAFERRAFADTMREMLYRLNPPIRRHRLLGEYVRLATLVDNRGWEIAKTLPDVRRLLQRLGTDAGRDVLGEDTWINAIFRHSPARLVIPDVRFVNEKAAIERRGGVVIRIERPKCGPINNHASETALDAEVFHAVITNGGEIEELEKQVEAHVTKIPGAQPAKD